ncbi:hypothetical protein Ciccas_013684, partial [Cichlidogyrus casuarinus]
MEMDFSVTLFMRQYWEDPRLRFSDKYNKTLNLNSMSSRLWVPDIYFVNEKSGNTHSITMPNRLIRINPD